MTIACCVVPVTVALQCLGQVAEVSSPKRLKKPPNIPNIHQALQCYSDTNCCTSIKLKQFCNSVIICYCKSDVVSFTFHIFSHEKNSLKNS